MAHIGYGYGSEWHLLQYLGYRRAALTSRVENVCGLQGVEWRDHAEESRTDSDAVCLREIRGLEFLSADDPVRREWEQVWPHGGNVQNWDAVATALAGQQPAWILVEAKAHTGELLSSCGAKSETSRQKIQVVFKKTQADLGVVGSADWMRGYYQYANRIALLHFLRSRNVNAHLLFVYFWGERADLGMRSRICPSDENQWRPSLREQDRHIGLPVNADVRQAIHKLFLPAYRANISARAVSKNDRLELLLKHVRADGRVCPLPQAWSALYELLPNRRQLPNGGSEPAVPLILGGWAYTSDEEKAERLAEHLRYAKEQGALVEIDSFVRSLRSDEWHYRSSGFHRNA